MRHRIYGIDLTVLVLYQLADKLFGKNIIPLLFGAAPATVAIAIGTPMTVPDMEPATLDAARLDLEQSLIRLEQKTLQMVGRSSRQAASVE